MRRALFIIIGLFSTGCATVSAPYEGTRVVSTIRNGVTLTFKDESVYADSIVLSGPGQHDVWPDNPPGSARVYRVSSGWSEEVNGQTTNRTVTVVARAYCHGRYVGSSTERFNIFNEWTDKVVWQIGGTYNAAGADRYYHSNIVPSDRKVCNH